MVTSPAIALDGPTWVGMEVSGAPATIVKGEPFEFRGHHTISFASPRRPKLTSGSGRVIIWDVASLIALFRSPLRFVGDSADSSVSRDIPPDDAAGCPPRDRAACRRSPRPRSGTLSRPIVVVSSGRRAASWDHPANSGLARAGAVSAQNIGTLHHPRTDRLERRVIFRDDCD